jgi:CO/xanthine dehydrogenase FAD-binding subunit
MEASTEALPNDKDNDAVKAYFKKVFPTMDFERVYVSDMRKMVKWSASLKTNNVNLAPAEDKPVVEEVVAPAVEEKPAKAEKVAKAKKEEGAAEAPAEVKEPAKKKAAPKKTAEAKNEAGKEEAPAKKAAPKKKKAE